MPGAGIYRILEVEEDTLDDIDLKPLLTHTFSKTLNFSKSSPALPLYDGSAYGDDR